MAQIDKAFNVQNWYRLDNIGKAYPLIRTNQQTTLFRFTAILTEKADPEKITDALRKILPRFPYFQVVLKPGFFWYYFERTTRLPPVLVDKHYPCTQYERHWSIPPIIIYYKENRISLEMSHALTDGYGGTIFFKALLNSYFGVEFEGEYNLGEAPNEEEWEDTYNKYFDPSVPPPKRGNAAFHLPFPKVLPGIYYSTTGILSLKEALSKAKSEGGSLTQWLIAKYITVLTEMIQDNDWKPAPVVLNVPVDLRRIYSTKTLRNFYITVTPTIDSRIGYFSFAEILLHVKNFMNIQIDRRYISQQLKRNVNLERSLVIRIIPLIIKRIIFPFFFYLFGERQFSGGLSNLGTFSLPEESSKKVKEIHILVPPSSGNLIKAGCLSYGGQLFITFGSLTENRELERRFFAKLREDGLAVRIDVNY